MDEDYVEVQSFSGASRTLRVGRRPPGTDDLIRYARAEFIADRIDVNEFEAALDHIWYGERDHSEFPYLVRGLAA